MGTMPASRQLIEACHDGLAAGPTGMAVWADFVAEPTTWPEHDHVEHELLIVTSGTFSLEIAGSLWLVPPTLGVWIPPFVRHRADAEPGTTYACVYVRADRCPIAWTEPTVVATGPMLLATVGHLARQDLALAARRRAESVLYDLVHPVSSAGTELPMPTDDRAERVARALLRDPADDRCLEDWGLIVGASPRTLQRLFSAQTGMSFEHWRLQARVRGALVRLAQGASVAEVSRRTGYASTSAFVARFRRVTGMTPGQYAAQCATQSSGGFATSIVG
ncbi:AraC family transcriptional regulator [Pimelobacter sp. 30-1]|uniref:helix-turn-helix domain-containing protein n=1 Tax=Pimelobacter sp. 30-1 TaxID=2004991 RepID=UPI001C0489EE|nr:AraC family transcriptional regulator [Pimelobacter sp. 30-1]MBU2694805.1 hypothetical protein [Pimelobacter sp. 30-1]